MRTTEQNKAYMNYYRFKKRLDKVRDKEKCKYCGGVAETLHHINERHDDNSSKNLIPLCHKCHLEVIHNCDKPNYYNQTEACKMPKEAEKWLKGAVIPTKTLTDILNNCNTTRVYNVSIRKPRTNNKINIIEGSKRLVEFIKGLGYLEVC